MATTTPTLTALRAAARGLIFMSESDSKVKVVQLDAVEGITSAQEAVAAAASVDPGELKAIPIDKFLAPMTTEQSWHEDEDKEAVVGFKALEALLTGLEGAMAYRVGDGPVAEVYILGKAPEGGYAGVKTRVTET